MSHGLCPKLPMVSLVDAVCILSSHSKPVLFILHSVFAICGCRKSIRIRMIRKEKSSNFLVVVP